MEDERKNDCAGNVRRSDHGGERCCRKEDRRSVAGWIRKNCDDSQINDDDRRADDYVRHRRYAEGLGQEVSQESLDRPICTKNLHADIGPSTSRGPCPRKDVLAKFAPTTDPTCIREAIERVTNEEITTAAEFIFTVAPCVRDKGLLFRQILEKELKYFREIVDDTVDRRVQDEADVMMHTQNKIKNKFKTLTQSMSQRTMRIRQRLYEISPKFDWAADGRDKAKIMKLIIDPLKKKENDGKEGTSFSNSIDKLTHQVFMRGQWLKKELTRLQDENKNLQLFLDKFRKLASKREQQECHVPRMLTREKKQLDRQLDDLRMTYNRNSEIINALYVEHHRCVKPPIDDSDVDGI